MVFAGATAAAVYVPDEQADRLRLSEAVEENPEDGVRFPVSFALSGRSAVAEAFRTRHPVWHASAETGGAEVAGPRAAASGAAADATGEDGGEWLEAVPLTCGETLLGCLVVKGAGLNGVEAERRGFLELYADQVAARMESEGACAAGGGVSGPVPAARSGGSGLGLGDLGSLTLSPANGRIEADRQALDLLGLAEEDFDGRVETVLAQTVPEDAPALMSVLEPSAGWPGGHDLEFRIRRPGGVLRWLRLRFQVLADQGGRPRLLGVIAEASYLRSAGDQVSRLQRLSIALAASMTVGDVSRAVVTALRDPLGADCVVLAELHAGRLVVTGMEPQELAVWGTWRSQWYSEWPDASLGDLPTLESVLRQGRTRLWPSSIGLEPGLAATGPGGFAALPLPAEGRVAGVCLLGWDRPHEFGAEERALLTAAAGLIGQALARARARDAEHEFTATLQRSLLPRTLPVLPGCTAVARYLPATTGLAVGGDWYDVIPVSDRSVALVIGDVQGHSVEAAAIMGQIRTAIRAYAVEGHPPDVVMSHANRLLIGLDTEAFATCCYVAFDVEEGEAWVVRAGHPQPVVRSPDGCVLEVEAEGGPPLGVIAEADFPMTALGVAPGAVVALFTDGLVESSKLPLEDGVRRVCRTLAAADPGGADRTADELLGTAEWREDDVALLLLRYDGLPIQPRRASWSVWRLPDAVMHARRFTARVLRSWNETREADTVLLVVSELVTNAMTHTRGEAHLHLTLAGERLRVAVSDSSPRAPVKPASIDWMATGGRGILLVEAVCAAWGSVPLSGGKQVWGEIELPPEPAAAGARREAARS
ncbi:Serine phosphatase RsbU, regulator of sigma subunit [Actinacidiphila paucisporea]|uniref:protein-serine/threonine phosphatase n=2 Tax=Actinacidiphila paucisporea TaxID=310782 RepID=A0A1M7Q9G8_9ACTN|nr:Serine phosphatase RsbU, regulator of sigma subunit [Actinacidiphila paucisporea]